MAQNRISAAAVQACASALTRTMNDINQLWDDGDYFTHQETFVDLLQSGYDIHVDFYTSLCGFSAQCDKNDKILESIKCELKIAEEQAEFDEDVVPEIKKSFSYSRKRKKKHILLIQSKITSHKEDVSHEKSNLINLGKDRNVKTLKKAITGGGAVSMGFVGALATEAVIDTRSALILGSVVGTVLGGAFVAGFAAGGFLGNHVRNKKAQTLIAKLDKLISLMTDLQKRSDQFTVALGDLITDLEQYVGSAAKNLEYSQASGSRVKAMASKMITETAKLQECFRELKNKAGENTRKLREMILDTKPAALLTMY